LTDFEDELNQYRIHQGKRRDADHEINPLEKTITLRSRSMEGNYLHLLEHSSFSIIDEIVFKINLVK